MKQKLYKTFFISFFLGVTLSFFDGCMSCSPLSVSLMRHVKMAPGAHEEGRVFYQSLISISSRPSGRSLLTAIDELFNLYLIQRPDSKILIQKAPCGQSTRFFPGTTTCSPPIKGRACKMRQEIELMIEGKKAEILSKNKELINRLYKLVGGNETKSLSMQYYRIQSKLRDQEGEFIEKNKSDVSEFKKLEGEIEKVAKSLQQTPDIEISSKSLTSQNNLCIMLSLGDENYKNPSATDTLESKVNVSLYQVPFFIILAHELIHLKHYLEEEIYKDGSIQDSSGELQKLFAESGMTFDQKKLQGSFSDRKGALLQLQSQKSVGNSDLVLVLGADINDLQPIARLGYSVAGSKNLQHIPFEKLPEFGGQFCNKDKLKLLDMITDLEERRTVLGPDRDGITENEIRKEHGLPQRYIYQQQEITESVPVFDEVIPGGTSYIEKQKVFWQAESEKEDAGRLFDLIAKPAFNIEGAIFLWESGKLEQTFENLYTLEELYKKSPQTFEEETDPFLQWIEIQRQILVEQTEQDLTTEDAIAQEKEPTEDISPNSNPEKNEEEENAEDEEQPIELISPSSE